MTPDEFSGLAQRLGPNVVTRPILDAVQFKAGGKTFATLAWPQDGWAVVKLDPRRQAWALSLGSAVTAEPGRRRRAGILLVRLAILDAAIASELLAAAWAYAMRGKMPRVNLADDTRGRAVVAA